MTLFFESIQLKSSVKYAFSKKKVKLVIITDSKNSKKLTGYTAKGSPGGKQRNSE